MLAILPQERPPKIVWTIRVMATMERPLSGKADIPQWSLYVRSWGKAEDICSD
jgi:hypothetical protein